MADQDDLTVSQGGYTLSFYPGFASRCTVLKQDGSTVDLYQQDSQKPFKLPGGQAKPRDKYRIHLEGGAKKQDVKLEVTDPAHRIKSITVELYGDDHEVGTGKQAGTEDTLTLMNNSVVCPPTCE